MSVRGLCGFPHPWHQTGCGLNPPRLPLRKPCFRLPPIFDFFSKLRVSSNIRGKQTQNGLAPRHSAGGCAMSCRETRSHFAFGGSSGGGVQTRRKLPGLGTKGRHSPGKLIQRNKFPAIMETVISVSVTGIGFFGGSDMSSTFNKAANPRFLHAKHPGRKGDGQVVILAFVAVKH